MPFVNIATLLTDSVPDVLGGGSLLVPRGVRGACGERLHQEDRSEPKSDERDLEKKLRAIDD